MYRKPTVRIVDQQREESKPVEVTSAEANDLLAKYGYSKKTNHSTKTNVNVPQNPSNKYTFEEMYQMQLKAENDRREREYKMRNSPKAITFNSNNINYSEENYRNLDDNFGIKVQIVTDMKINRR